MGVVQLARPWLTFDLCRPHQVLSWAVHRPGLAEARHIVWREVRNADLTAEFNSEAWLGQELKLRGQGGAVGFLTSRNVSCFEESSVIIGATTAHAVVTVGLSNAERVGHRVAQIERVGTINVAVQVDQGLSLPAMVEASSIAVQARTAAMLAHDVSTSKGMATGTGTDCVAVAAPAGDLRYAGLHTELGEAVGRVVYDCVTRGVAQWLRTHG
ncbi:adenosylcobinamide amidohydrolase [Qingshengfaniella alkalisoli]|uniref:Adenosylcobinamide amidohydrolase n=1 Tax=Qingshengfaniella alkalisoli TaxID=2599296 RepID=A0A5B8IDC9_9RHOB|nr:adenosylcobinamide amidohydrolase [Qingshengfaniella alkalisoli]QDY71686.1 adenosylcobinamide amidohydrolase [Qingshengfaniella alkalisoli]